MGDFREVGGVGDLDRISAVFFSHLLGRFSLYTHFRAVSFYPAYVLSWLFVGIVEVSALFCLIAFREGVYATGYINSWLHVSFSGKFPRRDDRSKLIVEREVNLIYRNCVYSRHGI